MDFSDKLINIAKNEIGVYGNIIRKIRLQFRELLQWLKLYGCRYDTI